MPLWEEINNTTGRHGDVSVDVVIPTYKPGRELTLLLRRLALQTLPVRRVIIINTVERYWNDAAYEEFDYIHVTHISEDEYDHGGTRHMAMGMTDAEIVVFMTQDALPADNKLIEYLAEPLLENRAAASYARQLPRRNAPFLEKFTRQFNYPDKSAIKGLEDAEDIGIKAFFFSDVCAAYDRRKYYETGGFPRPVVFNEDMVIAARLMESGYCTYYAAEARVYHSHAYSFMQQFRRNFDIGVSHADFADLIGRYPSVREGRKLVKETAGYICREHKYPRLFELVWISGWKYLGYSLGKRYRKLPKGIIKRCTSNPAYWRREWSDDKRQV